MSKSSSLKNKIQIPQARTSCLLYLEGEMWCSQSVSADKQRFYCINKDFFKRWILYFYFSFFSPRMQGIQPPNKGKVWVDWLTNLRLCVIPKQISLNAFSLCCQAVGTLNSEWLVILTWHLTNRKSGLKKRDPARVTSRKPLLWHMQEWPLIWFVCLCNLFKTNLWSLSFEQLTGKLIKREEHMWNWIRYVKQANCVSGSSLGQGLLYIPESCQWRLMCSCLLTFYILLLIWNTCSGGGSQLHASHYFTSFVMKQIFFPP